MSLSLDLLAFLLSSTTLNLKNTSWTNAATWQQIPADNTIIIKQVASNKSEFNAEGTKEKHTDSTTVYSIN